MALLGTIFYVALLLINAMAVLSEDRFLARIGWSSSQTRNAAFQQPYDPTGYGSPPQDIGVKARIVDLISAVRTLMRIPLIGINIVIIVWEVVF
ncbi:hypothetical protein EYR40_005631 [Pleurotus pulmonarius]|uniref:Yos1-like protein n=1 Tax=Pleurotus eryngii TaxID=5323 RepID=A0A9P5ZQU9_PLEER|nr:hypothetical protein EYR36_005972 [Pleurotus pulmonarius]KAF4600680.1 hypothetical protein EYR38_005323 [Pleurotus pulmonarius]KAF4602424.1 hypothetical protein EYR40_005631 [Pleurotus pulmonarius]KAF9491040.1 Yos1-like protein [Pleurotus eryngii]